MRTNTLCVVLSLWVCLLVGCGQPKLSPLTSDDVIVAFGDSLTVGVGVDASDSYPTALSRLTGMTVISAGVSGETTQEGLARFPEVIEQHQPDLIVLLEGGNDILRNRSSQQTEQNLSEMVEIAVQSNIDVVLIGVPEKRLLSDSAPFYDRIAEQYDLVYEPDVIGQLMRDASKKSDPIHFNRDGYAALAQRVYELLSENGAL